jgi:hypothetical protein
VLVGIFKSEGDKQEGQRPGGAIGLARKATVLIEDKASGTS